MIQLGILIAALLVLSFVSQLLTQTLYMFNFWLFRNRSIAVSIVTALFFPGTVIHELSHLFTAEILRVPTGKITLAPDTIDDPEIRAGSVMIAQTDPIRRTLIGTAPLTWGVTNLIALSYIFQPFATQLISYPMSTWIHQQAFYIVLGLAYLIFSISNSMYPSSTDLEGVWAVAVTISIFLLVAFLVGFKLTLTGTALVIFDQITNGILRSLGIVFLINCSLLLLLSIPLWISRGLMSRR